MPEQDFLPFATGVGANVLDQADYVAAEAGGFVQNGFAAGLAQSNELNKVWRQSSFVAAAVAAFMLQELNIDILDDGNLTEFLANFTAAIKLGGNRTALGANTNFFISPAGSDANDGKTSGTPWLTLQHAWDTLHNSYDLAGFAAVVNVADGTYTQPLLATGFMVGSNGANSVQFVGDIGSPASVFINVANGNGAIGAANYGQVQIAGMELQSTAAGALGNCVYAANGGQISIAGPMVFGTANGAHINSLSHSIVTISASYTIAGSAPSHFLAQFHGYIVNTNSGFNIALTGSITFSTAFCTAVNVGIVNVVGITASGSIPTGKRYIAESTGLIQTNGGGPTFFPGTIAGTVDSQGLYI